MQPTGHWTQHGRHLVDLAELGGEVVVHEGEEPKTLSPPTGDVALCQFKVCVVCREEPIIDPQRRPSASTSFGSRTRPRGHRSHPAAAALRALRAPDRPNPPCAHDRANP